VDPLQLNARLIGAAGGYFVGPEVPTALIWLTIEKVMIMLADVVPRVINRIRGRLCRVVIDSYRGDRRRAQACSQWIAQIHMESLGSFNVRVVVDEHGEALRRLAGTEAERANRGNVIAPLSGRNV